MKRTIQREGEASLGRATGVAACTRRVLVADDNDFMRHCVQLLLVRERCEIVASAENGLQLVSNSQLHEHDLIVTDYHMPSMDGMQAARAILAQQPDSRIIVLTSDDDCSSARSALDLGIMAYVLKDCMVPDLPLAIAAVMAGNPFLSPSIGCLADKPFLAGADLTLR